MCCQNRQKKLIKAIVNQIASQYTSQWNPDTATASILSLPSLTCNSLLTLCDLLITFEFAVTCGDDEQKKCAWFWNTAPVTSSSSSSTAASATLAAESKTSADANQRVRDTLRPLILSLGATKWKLRADEVTTRPHKHVLPSYAFHTRVMLKIA
jgi:hypothetical protein